MFVYGTNGVSRVARHKFFLTKTRRQKYIHSWSETKSWRRKCTTYSCSQSGLLVQSLHEYTIMFEKLKVNAVFQHIFFVRTKIYVLCFIYIYIRGGCSPCAFCTPTPDSFRIVSLSNCQHSLYLNSFRLLSIYKLSICLSVVCLSSPQTN